MRLYGKQAKKDFRYEKYNENKLLKWKNLVEIN